MLLTMRQKLASSTRRAPIDRATPAGCCIGSALSRSCSSSASLPDDGSWGTARGWTESPKPVSQGPLPEPFLSFGTIGRWGPSTPPSTQYHQVNRHGSRSIGGLLLPRRTRLPHPPSTASTSSLKPILGANRTTYIVINISIVSSIVMNNDCGIMKGSISSRASTG